MPTKIRLQTYDGEFFNTDVEVLKFSGTIQRLLEGCSMDDSEFTIPLHNVNAATLRKILKFAEYHRYDPVQTQVDEEKPVEMSPWDAEFLKVNQGTLFEILLAANYLDAKHLMKVSCQSIANMMGGKTPEEIRQLFKIKNDFTEAEEKQVRMENEWCDNDEK